MLVKNKTTPDTWFLRFYEDTGEKRVYRRQRIGTVREFPHRRDAEKAVLALRGKINTEVSSPETVNDLLTHYQKYELTPARKAYSSIQNHLTLAKCYIAPRWGSYKLGAVRTVQVEEWLDSLSLAPASKTKIKSVFSVLYSHAIRHEWVSLNPISKVRTSSKRLREKDVLTPTEFQALLEELSVRDRAMVLLAGSTGGSPIRAHGFCLVGCECADDGSKHYEILCAQPVRRHKDRIFAPSCSTSSAHTGITARLEAPIAL